MLITYKLSRVTLFTLSSGFAVVAALSAPSSADASPLDAGVDARDADATDALALAEAGGDAEARGDAEAGGPTCASFGGNCQNGNLGQCTGGGTPFAGADCSGGQVCCPDQGKCNGDTCCATCTCWADAGAAGACSVCESSPMGCNGVVTCGNIFCGPGCQCADAGSGGACSCP